MNEFVFVSKFYQPWNGDMVLAVLGVIALQ